MSYVNVDVEVDFWDVWEGAGENEAKQAVKSYIKEHPEIIPEVVTNMDTSPAHVLETIIELRKLGYIVEPA